MKEYEKRWNRHKLIKSIWVQLWTLLNSKIGGRTKFLDHVMAIHLNHLQERATYNLDFLGRFGLGLASKNTHFRFSFMHLSKVSGSCLTWLWFSRGWKYLWHRSPFFSLGWQRTLKSRHASQDRRSFAFSLSPGPAWIPEFEAESMSTGPEETVKTAKMLPGTAKE
jgi:hypothetical protein